MEAIRDIFINLLSDAAWALGGFLFARFALKKNPLISDYSDNGIHLKKNF